MVHFDYAYDGANIAWDDRNVRSPRAIFGQIRYLPGGYVGPRVQRDYEIILMHSGSCTVRVDDGANRPLAVGLAYLFRPGHQEHFLYDSRIHSHHSWCSVSPAFFPDVLRLSLDAVPEGSGFPPSDCFMRIVSAAFLFRSGQSASARQVVDTLGLALFAEFVHMVDHATSPIRDASVNRAKQYMEDHLREPDCLAQAMDAAGCSKSALSYKFANELGTSPARYLWRIRTEKGLELLTDTGLSIAEIADRCGFQNPFHFSRCIRLMQGLPPREIRRRAWTKEPAYEPALASK
ncbi:MAG TPA: AraC family transcriptional regulator [Kiritimatiellia bacterium]|nr:AraC family transcriptional regulator [Kiritimatiellia bacterium]HPS07185.1 AraC family transcriptional regulator [Kiritimatiellia bacterium]